MPPNSPDSVSIVMRAPARAPHVLLVCQDRLWAAAVREAVAGAGGIVETVSARDAVARLAGARFDTSHLLVELASGDGMVDALLSLSSDPASAGATFLSLGVVVPGFRVIAAPTRRSISAALAVARKPIRHARPALPLAELMVVVNGQMIETRYQPIVRLGDRGVTSVEVLARLNHPVYGTLTPDWFIPRLEDSGLASALTSHVSARAFADRAGPAFPHLTIAVNYPLDVLSHPEVAFGLDQMRASYGLLASDVVIELTESREVEDFNALTRSLEHLRAIGYRISIDDVGPAVKNLDRLLTLPFTGLKLDKSIVDRIGTSHEDAATAPDIVTRALTLGLNVVAEGVETRVMWDRLRALGVREAQGYFIARPLPAAAVPVWLEAWNADQG